MLKTLPDTPGRGQQELTLQLALSEGSGLLSRAMRLQRWKKPMLRAQELCQQLGETPQLIRVLQWLTTVRFARGGAPNSTCAGRAVPQPSPECARHQLSWRRPTLCCRIPCTALGEFVLAQDHQKQAITLYDPQKEKCHSPDRDCLSWAAWTLWYLGYPDQGLKRSQEAVALAEGLSHPFSRAYALVCAAKFHLLRREEQLARERAEGGDSPINRAGVSVLVSKWDDVRGAGRWQSRKRERGESSSCAKAWLPCGPSGQSYSQPYYLALLAEAHEKAGTDRRRAERAGRGASCSGQNWGVCPRGGAVSAKRRANAQQAIQGKSKVKSQKSPVPVLTPSPKQKLKRVF